MTTEPYTPDKAELIDSYAGIMNEYAGENYDQAQADAERGIAKLKADALREAAESARAVIDIGSGGDSAYHHGARYGQRRFADWLDVRADRIEREA